MRRTLELTPGSRRNQGGIVLPDVLLSLTIVVIAVVALASASLSTTKLRNTVTEKQRAMDALDEQVQVIQATPYAQILGLHSGRGFTVDPEGRGVPVLQPLPGDLDGLPGSVAVIAPAPPADPARLLEVQVSVNWVGKSGPQDLVRTIRISRLGGF
jgi:hypothetical protein